MKKSYKGFCPPFIAIGLVLLFMILNSVYMVAHAADNVIPGSEVAPPGGSTTIYTEPSTTSDVGGTVVDTSGTTTPTEPKVPPTIDEPQTPDYIVTPDGTETTPVEPADPTTSNDYTTQGVPDGINPGLSTDTNPNPDTTVTPPDSLIPDVGIVAPPENTPDPVGTYPAKIDTTGVTISSPSLNTLLAPGADLEALLYPSGLKLPTKYMDLLMCAPVNTSSTVSGEAAYLLKTAAPTENSVYTYAEYKAAELYLAMCRLAQSNSTDKASATSAAVVNLDNNTTVNWMQNVTNATLTDSKRMVALISNYKELLESVGQGSAASGHKQYKDFIASHKGVRYSWGNLDDLISAASSTSSNDQNLSEYVTGLYSWWDYVGVTHTITSAITEYSIYYDEFSYNGVNYNRGAPISAIVADTTPGIDTPGTLEPGQSSGNQSTVSGPALEGSTGQGNIVTGSSDSSNWTVTEGKDTPVASVGGPQSMDTSTLPSGGLGIREVGSTMALVFVVIAVICLLLIQLVRKGGRFF